METQLYMRVRGRVLGPYDQEKLQGLARRGQLSRMHEVSPDGVSWVRASTYPDLFTGEQGELPTLASEVSKGTGKSSTGGDGQLTGDSGWQPSSNLGAPPTAAGSHSKWFYTSGGEQRGPVDFSNLQILAGLGQLNSYDQVWAEGMATWVPATQVPGLVKSNASQDPNQSTLETAKSSRLSDGLCRSASDSRGWAMFIAFTMYLYAVASTVFGILVVITGARERNAGTVGYGIGSLVHALVIIVGGALLSTYVSRLGKLRYMPNPEILERALDALRNFWIFVSMYLIVVLALIVIAAIAVFAYDVTLPHISL